MKIGSKCRGCWPRTLATLSEGSLQALSPCQLGGHLPGPPRPPPAPQVAESLSSQPRIERAIFPYTAPKPRNSWVTRSLRLSAVPLVFKKSNHLILQTILYQSLLPAAPKVTYLLACSFLRSPLTLFLSPHLEACAFSHPTGYFRNLGLQPKGPPTPTHRRPGWGMKSGAGGTGLAV